MGKQLTATEQMGKLFDKCDSIRSQYADALERAIDEVQELKESIAEGKTNLQEIYKSYVLGSVELGAYQSEKKIVADVEAILHVAEQKIADVANLQNDELYGVYQEMKEIHPEYSKENTANKVVERKKMFTAKVEYLKAMESAKIQVETTNKYVKMLDHLKVEIGLKNDYSYDFEDSVVTSLLHNDYTGAVGLEVSKVDISNAYNHGKVSTGVLGQAGLLN